MDSQAQYPYTHDLMSLFFRCHLTLYAVIAAYKVAANFFPSNKNTWYEIDVHLKSKDTKDSFG